MYSIKHLARKLCVFEELSSSSLDTVIQQYCKIEQNQHIYSAWKTYISSFLRLKVLCEWLSEKTRLSSWLGSDSLEYKFSANFSISKAFHTVKHDIQINCDVKNSHIWHFIKSFISYVLFSTNLALTDCIYKNIL